MPPITLPPAYFYPFHLSTYTSCRTCQAGDVVHPLPGGGRFLLHGQMEGGRRHLCCLQPSLTTTAPALCPVWWYAAVAANGDDVRRRFRAAWLGEDVAVATTAPSGERAGVAMTAEATSAYTFYTTFLEFTPLTLPVPACLLPCHLCLPGTFSCLPALLLHTWAETAYYTYLHSTTCLPAYSSLPTYGYTQKNRWGRMEGSMPYSYLRFLGSLPLCSFPLLCRVHRCCAAHRCAPFLPASSLLLCFARCSLKHFAHRAIISATAGVARFRNIS